MKIVKITFNYDWPIFRQIPNEDQIWEDYKFIIDDNLKECDFWIIYSDYNIQRDRVLCPPENIIFIPGEPKSVSGEFSKSFLKQFGLVISSQTGLKHENVILSHNANPWFVNKSFNELLNLKDIKKTKLISIITSDKKITKGHRKRYDFVMKLKDHFGDQLDLFGRGIKGFEDKWDVLADYKYSIAIENDFCDFYVTEKFYDCILTNTLPFYYGCPNLEQFSDKKSFIRIDINDFDKSVLIIEKAIENDEYTLRRKNLKDQKNVSLYKEQFFPFIINFIDKMEIGKKKIIELKPNVKNDLVSVCKKIKKKWLLKRLKIK
jgi:hypothetical protein